MLVAGIGSVIAITGSIIGMKITNNILAIGWAVLLSELVVTGLYLIIVMWPYRHLLSRNQIN
jgi:hypothetical protein